eukprot:gene11117-35177_t
MKEKADKDKLPAAVPLIAEYGASGFTTSEWPPLQAVLLARLEDVLRHYKDLQPLPLRTAFTKLKAKDINGSAALGDIAGLIRFAHSADERSVAADGGAGAQGGSGDASEDGELPAEGGNGGGAGAGGSASKRMKRTPAADGDDGDDCSTGNENKLSATPLPAFPSDASLARAAGSGAAGAGSGAAAAAAAPVADAGAGAGAGAGAATFLPPAIPARAALVFNDAETVGRQVQFVSARLQEITDPLFTLQRFCEVLTNPTECYRDKSGGGGAGAAGAAGAAGVGVATVVAAGSSTKTAAAES